MKVDRSHWKYSYQKTDQIEYFWKMTTTNLNTGSSVIFHLQLDFHFMHSICNHPNRSALTSSSAGKFTSPCYWTRNPLLQKISWEMSSLIPLNPTWMSQPQSLVEFWESNEENAPKKVPWSWQHPIWTDSALWPSFCWRAASPLCSLPSYILCKDWPARPPPRSSKKWRPYCENKLMLGH